MGLRRGVATRLTVYLHADARWHHRSMSEEIVRRARAAGLAGASRFHGVEGFGASRRLHTDLDPDVMGSLPCAVEVVDASERRVREFAATLESVLDHGLVVLETVEVATVLTAPAGGRPA
jgi:PII-like signaling protein